MHQVRPGDTVERIAESYESTPWRILRDNGLLFDDELTAGMTLRVRAVPKPPEFLTHRVSRGENLSTIARRYGTSVSSIQAANSMGRQTMIRIGQRLRIPVAAE